MAIRTWGRYVFVVAMMGIVGWACADNGAGAGEETSCDHDSDCVKGMICQLNICVDEAAVPNPVSEDGKPGGYTDSCDSTEQCEEGLECVTTDNGEGICTHRCDLVRDEGNQDECKDPDAKVPMHCVSIHPNGDDIISVCYPRAQTYCHVCTREHDDLTGACGTVGADLCRKQVDDSLRCSTDCSDDPTICPDGASCQERTVEGAKYTVCVPDSGICEKCFDLDGDGYGDPAYDMSECEYPDVPDCDDGDADIHPGAATYCDYVDDACQGRVDADYTDENGVYNTIEHCGSCDTACSLPHAVQSCDTGTCAFVECEEGWINLDGHEQTQGCPYECTKTSDHDLPGDLRDGAYGDPQEDANCDGIDGDVARAYFVDLDTGKDSNSGTRQSPLKTISKALSRLGSSSSPIDQIYVSGGVYKESLTLVDGVSIYGGFNADKNWSRGTGSGYDVTIKSGKYDGGGHRIAVRGNNLSGTNPTVIQNVTIAALDATGAKGGIGRSSYAVFCTHCTSLRLVGSQIYAGKGANGLNGDNGYSVTKNPPASCRGNDGEIGGGGTTNAGPTGGQGYSCSVPGHASVFTAQAGGDGGDSEHSAYSCHGHDGESFFTQGIGGAGGAGVGAGKFSVGQDGKPGQKGATGTSGKGATPTTSLSAEGWYASKNGHFGRPGAPGGGGGGGGGGATHYAALKARRHSGGPGGSGGAGGCPGGGADGGFGGGSSIAVALMSSSGARIVNCHLTVSRAGNGGDGGDGGKGGKGCAGGLGAQGASANAKHPERYGGSGGDGGRGGDGGTGSGGGGGAGGAAFAILLGGTSLSPSNTTYTMPATAAKGGASGTPFNISDGRGPDGPKKKIAIFPAP